MIPTDVNPEGCGAQEKCYISDDNAYDFIGKLMQRVNGLKSTLNFPTHYDSSAALYDWY